MAELEVQVCPETITVISSNGAEVLAVVIGRREISAPGVVRTHCTDLEAGLAENASVLQTEVKQEVDTEGIADSMMALELSARNRVQMGRPDQRVLPDQVIS